MAAIGSGTGLIGLVQYLEIHDPWRTVVVASAPTLTILVSSLSSPFYFFLADMARYSKARFRGWQINRMHLKHPTDPALAAKATEVRGMIADTLVEDVKQWREREKRQRSLKKNSKPPRSGSR